LERRRGDFVYHSLTSLRPDFAFSLYRAFVVLDPTKNVGNPGIAYSSLEQIIATMVSITTPRGIAIQRAQGATMRDRIERITEDLKDIKNFYPIGISPKRTRELNQFLTFVLGSLRDLYDQEGKVDSLLVKNYLERQIRQLELESKQDEKAAPLLPFSPILIDLCEARALVKSLDPKDAAQKLFQSQAQIAALLEKIKNNSSDFQIEKPTAFRAVKTTDTLRKCLKEWMDFYKGYDPLFDWWVMHPYVTVDKRLEDLSVGIQEKLVCIQPGKWRCDSGKSYWA
jgi:hypothetical protein